MARRSAPDPARPPRTRRRGLRWLTGAVLLLLLLAAAAVAVLSLPAFGSRLDGERLRRAQADPQYRDGRFVNLEPEAPTTLAEIVDYLVRQFSGSEVRVPPAPLPVLPVATAALAPPPPAGGLRAFWIGHASVYLELDGLRLLLDPVFAERVSPLPVGPRRFHPTPLALADLPPVDAVLISHDHYDHLDMASVRHLAARGSRFFVPLGVGAHLARWGVPAAQVEELAWWQQRELRGVTITCTPTRHYSGRGLGDRSATLWSSWVAAGPAHRVFYSGDTGYGRHFAAIGERLGPFDLAFVKIGAYGPGAAWTDIHMPPEASVQAVKDVRAKRLFPVHWATFNLAYHDWDEPIRRTVAAAAAQRVPLLTPRLGEWVDGDREFASTAWWEGVARAAGR